MVYVIIMSVFFLLFTACGGGSSGDTSHSPVSDDTTEANHSLSGFLYFQDTIQSVYRINASSGLVEYVPNTNWVSQNDRFPSGVASFYSNPRPNNNTEFLVVASYCRRANSDPLSDQMSCLAIQDYQGNYHQQIDLVGTVTNSAKLSPNGQYIALYRDFNPGLSGYEWLEIYTRDGMLVSDRKHEKKKIQWLNDGRIIYTFNRHVYFTKNYSAEVGSHYSVPDILNNEDVLWATISDFSVSPDNTQIAFTLFNTWNSQDVYGDQLFVMNIDGSSIRKLAISMNDSYRYINDITWSPDGRWIMVKEGYSSPQGGSALGTSGYLYAIPTEDMGKVFQLSIIDSQRSHEVIQFQHDRNLTDPGVFMTTEALGSIKLEWLP